MTLLAPGNKLLFQGPDWNFDLIRRVHDACGEIAINEMGLDPYPNQIEVITTEQMLDAYASTGMPLFYRHWSFGKEFARNEALYRKGYQGLAYEIVINSNPCLVYIMEENSAMMQTLVIAHAGYGHSHFFKNNYVFKQWTDADGILDYLEFARGLIAKFEDRYGHEEVERVLDAAHALQSHGIHRFPRKRMPDLRSEQRREEERRLHGEQLFNDLWRTVPVGKRKSGKDDDARRKALLGLPEENLLYFLEKTAPRLAPWQREILRMVRMINQYFYPQRQTKVMNEGCATYVHHRVMTRLHEKGQIDDGAFLEFLHSHTSVVMQPDFDDRRYLGINPYALGFAMCCDIDRICTNPTDEDREWMPDIAGNGDAYGTLRNIWANFRDESFVSQYLSPQCIRDFGLFNVHDDEAVEDMNVSAIHDERGYRKIRRALSKRYDVAYSDPDIQIVDVDLAGDRKLILSHRVLDGMTLEGGDADKVLQHVADLWGYDVKLVEADDSGVVRAEYSASPRRPFM
ncbi:SpoVR family protein [Candidatus Viadribacter manganicus]|uniref:SpoVR family protein n=1 Tax=Candidatus Viadribacter manganicus TaxID=1759059 RepID=A0A1B1AIH3_9PROT|nr:SpoVR family protein [Candidatus Viadribacter manganicus]ANP46367.1 SpoVR family protein [Candidatus Viadribacter manganicus]